MVFPSRLIPSQVRQFLSLWMELCQCSLVEDGQKYVLLYRCVAPTTVFVCSPALIQHLQGELLSPVKAVYEGKDLFKWLLTRFGNSICYQILPFFSDLKLGPICSGKSIIVLVISPMASLIVDHVQKLRDLSARASIISSSTVNCSSGSMVTGNWSKSTASCYEHLNLYEE